MSAEVGTFKLKGPGLDNVAAARVAAGLLARSEGDVVLDLRAVVTVGPGVVEILAGLARQRRALGLGSGCEAEGPLAEALGRAGVMAGTMAEQAEAEKDAIGGIAPEGRSLVTVPTQERMSPGSAAPAEEASERRTSSKVPTPRSVAVPKLPEQSAAMTDFGTIIAAVLSRKFIIAAVAMVAVAVGLVAGSLLGKSDWEAEAVLLYKPAQNQLSNDYEVLQNIDPTTTFVYRQSSQKDKSTVSTVQIKTLLNTIKIGANLEAVRAALETLR
ncbi:MAG: hypothetical protein WCL50_13220 [Spirochaetota bacterium]